MTLITRDSVRFHPFWSRVEHRAATARNVIELVGPGAADLAVAVDGRAAEPTERTANGSGATTLWPADARLVRHSLTEQLPFGTAEFDFAVCFHAFWHLDDPGAACRELERIAGAGVIVAPALVTGPPPDHRWIVVDGGDELCFFDRSVWNGRPERVARPPRGYPVHSVPAAASAAPPATAAALDIVFPWVGELHCRVRR